jgi:hypothetical protein
MDVYTEGQGTGPAPVVVASMQGKGPDLLSVYHSRDREGREYTYRQAITCFFVSGMMADYRQQANQEHCGVLQYGMKLGVMMKPCVRMARPQPTTNM